MAAKCTGAEFKRFYTDPAFWVEPKNAAGDPNEEYTYHDDAVFLLNGKETDEEFDPDNVADADIVSVEGGIVYGAVVGPKEPTLESYLRRWLKDQKTTSFLVECDKTKLEAVKAAIKAAGGKVSS